ncbi:copper chaperone PCu(A)C [Marinobacterium sp. YM272]|uniref:copper chaperone PCu(A)C n=1 Tax=Marinobacterium sp. YM272 TaxID=3421654 RepID=UPI003D7FBE73
MKTLARLLLLSALSVPAFAADVSVIDPYARAVPPGQPNSAAFMQISNNGDEAVTLTGAATSAAGTAELHAHIQDEGVMRMRRIDGIELPAGETVTLQPGGLHVMLIGLKKTLAEGDDVDLELQFSDGTSASLTLPVKPVMPMGMQLHKGDQ